MMRVCRAVICLNVPCGIGENLKPGGLYFQSIWPFVLVSEGVFSGA